MLERFQWRVDHTSITAGLDFLRDFPLLASVDEVWIAETHDNRDTVLFDRVPPDRRYAPIYTFVGERLLSRRDGLA